MCDSQPALGWYNVAMIANDQPRIFSDMPLRVAFSSASDGKLSRGSSGDDTGQHAERLKAFLASHHFADDTLTKLAVRFGDDKNYRTVVRVTNDNKGHTINADGFYTTQPGITLFLPVADCVATVVYDPTRHMLGILHLGRHSSAAHLIESFCDEVASSLHSDPSDWRVWMSPSLQQQNNALEYFHPESPDEWEQFVSRSPDGSLLLDIPAHNRQRFELLGVQPANIEVSQVNTYTDEQYFSHRAANDLQKPQRQGRMIVAAALL